MAAKGTDLAAKLSNAGRAADCYLTPRPQALVGDTYGLALALANRNAIKT